MSNTTSNDSPEKLIEFFDDILGEVAYDDKLQLYRKLEKIKAGNDPFNFLQSAIFFMLDEIGILKTEISRIRLETLANGICSHEKPFIYNGDSDIPLTFALTRCLEIQMGGFFSGTNWHFCEYDETIKSSFRWTGPGEISSINLFIDREVPLALEISISRGMTSEILNNLQLFIDQSPLLHEIKPSSCGYIIYSVIPPAQKHRKVSVLRLFHGSPLQSPKDIDANSNDDRVLGILVYSVRIYPILPQNAMSTG